jgi:Ca2+ transporting ATPase
MDTFAAMALATEEPTEALLDQKPYSRKDSIFTPVMWRNPTGTYDFIDRSAGSDDCAWFVRMQAKYGQYTAKTGQSYMALYQCNYIIADMEPDQYTYIVNGAETIIPDGDQLTGNVEVERNPGMCRHYAFLFNMYVFLQIFNEINAKKLLP